MKVRFATIASSLLIATGLVACGGGGGDAAASSAADTAASGRPSQVAEYSDESPLADPAASDNSSSDPGDSSQTTTPADPTASGSSPPLTTDETPAASQLLGANMPAISDYTRTQIYVDLVKQARRFSRVDSPWGGDADIVPLGEDGWPVGDFGVFLMTAQENLAGIAGTYKVSFDGQATVDRTASDAKIQNKIYDSNRNRTTLDVVLAEGAGQLVLLFTNTGTGIKNLQVIRPGYNADNPPLFTDAFLNHIKRFGTLRFMDWLRTNQNTVTTWDTRTDPQRMRTNPSRTGVPWEHVVALANVHEQDIWINIPVSATDDYVRQLARLLKNTLNSHSRIYVEYSNELWNGQFQQFGTNRALAEAEVTANPNSPLAYDGSQDANKWMYRRIAKRGKEISDIFRGVFGDGAMMSRVRPVFAIQVVWLSNSEEGLKFIDAVYGPPSRYFYAMAGAPYFNLGTQQRVDGLSKDQVLAAMGQSVTDLSRTNQFEKNQTLASWYQLRWMAYEGGADTYGPGSIVSKKQANEDGRMEDICKRYLSNWYQSGGQLFMWYTAGAGGWDTQYGAWELTTDLAITDTPKIRCIDQTLAGPTPAAEGRNKAPGSFESYAVAGSFPPYSQSSMDSVRHVRAGGYNDYLVQAEETGYYQLVLSAAMDSSGNSVDVSVNGIKTISEFPINGTGWSTVTDQAPMSVHLEKGFNTVRITTNTTNNGYDLRKLTFIKQ